MKSHHKLTANKNWENTREEESVASDLKTINVEEETERKIEKKEESENSEWRIVKGFVVHARDYTDFRYTQKSREKGMTEMAKQEIVA